MKYLLPVVLLGMFAALVVYVIKAEQIRDRMLRSAARVFELNSSAYRFQKWFTNNALYLISFRIVAFIAAVVVLAALIYVLRFW
jgi:hypothetical protein